MDTAIRHHFNKDILNYEQLTGGYTFETWLLTLSGNEKVVFRHQRDLTIGNDKEIIISEILEREKFFYENINKTVGKVCPEVYIIDGTRKFHENSFCIMEYIEGIPLDKCFDDLDVKVKNDTLYRIGELAANINNMVIAKEHPYVKTRGVWEIFISNRLRDRFIPLIHRKVITKDEADAIAEKMLKKSANKNLSFLHLDMRRVNMIYNKGDIFLLDAENCEFGDPLFELSTIDCGGELDKTLIDGYIQAYNGSIDLDDDLYYFYKMERMALVLHVFMNIVKSDIETQKYLKVFNELKHQLSRL